MNSKLKLALLSSVVLLSAAFSVHGFIPNDGDGDGVPDSVDVCPNEDSSPFDRNGDGILNERDLVELGEPAAAVLLGGAGYAATSMIGARRPCSAHGPEVCPLGHHRCMRELGVEQVFQAVESMNRGNP